MNQPTTVSSNIARCDALTRRRKGHSSVEFAASLFVFFLVMLFPLLNLTGLALSAGMLCMLAHQIATRASQQLTYAEALSSMKSECSRLSGSGWANFLKLQPRAGYQHCGSDLYIESTQIAGSNVQIYGPNTPLPNPPNANNVYEFVASTSFQVKPFIAMSGVPIVAQIPALGQPVEIKWSATRAVEHVAGLSNINFSMQNSNLNFPNLTLLAGKDPPPTYLDGAGVNPPHGWRNPGVYSALPPNLTIVGMDVFLVPSNSMNWVHSALTINGGQSVWIDTHADGTWVTLQGDVGNITSSSSRFDANGAPGPSPYNQWSNAMAIGQPPATPPFFMELIGFVGGSPPNLESILNQHVPPKPLPAPFTGYFEMRDNSLTPSPGTGNLAAICNDSWRQNNEGEQVVRALVLQP